MTHDTQSVSRATSISRASKQGSSVSRTQSLIKKNVAPQDLRPSDVLIERFVAWKAIVKQLIAYFEGVAHIQNNISREMTRLAGVIQVPFRAGNQFLGEGGLQDVFYGIRDKTRVIADQHANLGRTIDSSIVQHLHKLLTEIKAHIKNVQNDTGKLATNVAKERELSAKLIADLASSISAFKNTPMSVTNKSDPYVANLAVVRQLQKQVHEENLLQKSIIIMQQNSAHFEEGIVRSIQSAWQTFDEWQSRSSLAIQDIYRTLATRMSTLAPDREWISFSARSDHLLDPDTPLRNPEHIVYPSKDDPSVVPVHTGHLERKKRFTRKYRESYFVLTPAGFLHEYASSDPATHEGITPLFSLFLPACTLGPPSSVRAASHKFHIEGRKDGTGTLKTGGAFRALTRSGEHAWSFRARSREDMMEWWNDIRMLCARYLVASEQMDRTGPVAAAVRAAGYVSEEEEEEEEEGSSVEEEPEEGVDEEMYVEAAAEPGEDGQPPSYSHPEKHISVEMGPNGYPIEKKHAVYQPNGVAAGPSSGPDIAAQDDAAAGTELGRRLSRRQQEKAPEGRGPAPISSVGPDPDVDAAPPAKPEPEPARVPSPPVRVPEPVFPKSVSGESRFTEGL
ncbi:putative pleckstrin homology domain [Lyophyllum shimeji]|uniref:Pleckstrin homology domain n=1 Tax=Lyophyllum shimeji TaxID=47721 RepID=A0A9P3PRB7_LYOSH|nr:putative pleckstrin homology domain [Lyophyllum shimeji]